MDFISNLVSYLTDKETRFPKKAIFIFLIVIGFIAIDKVFSFSYFFNNSYKIEQVKEIKSVIPDTTLSKKEVYQLKQLRSEIINHKSLFQKDYTSFFKFQFKDGRNSSGHYWTSSLFFYISILSIILAGFERNRPTIKATLIMYLLVIPSLILLSFPFAQLLSLIPLLMYGIFNYILNALISITLLIVVMKAINKRIKD